MPQLCPAPAVHSGADFGLSVAAPKTWPHVTTDPFAKIAANACSVASTCWTLRSWFWTAELLPPKSGFPKWFPLSPFCNAKALCVAATFGWSNSSPACNNSVWDRPGDVRLPALGTFVPWEFLGLKFEVPYFGGWKWKVFTPTTGKSYAELNHNMFWSTLRRGEKRSVFSSIKRLMLNPAISWLERLPKVQQEAGTVWHLNYFSWVLAPICWKIKTFQSGHNLGAIPGPTLSG